MSALRRGRTLYWTTRLFLVDKLTVAIQYNSRYNFLVGTARLYRVRRDVAWRGRHGMAWHGNIIDKELFVMQTEKNRENRLRRQLRKQGLSLHKSRVQNPNVNNLGGYMIVNECYNAVAWGSRFELDLDDVEDFISE